MAELPADDGSRYWAFISYSHRDAAFGRRLHRQLENYALPRRLVGRETKQGTVPRKLAPIFRDREEFAAAHDLSAEVREALRQSRCLIVVCSPASAGSQWVSREITLFRELHPDRPILAAVRNGEPHECFPPALLGTDASGAAIEPLAADFRRGRDGEHLALLKLVAGVLGLGLDELVQRDATRRNRRVTAITAGALVAMVVMGVLTAFALNARSEADRQRAEAEGLVEYMLTDLRDKLKGVGRLDVMTAVNERALKYYSDQDLAKLPIDSLERRARILHAMGGDDETRGDLVSALAKYHEANRTTAVLLADAPNDPKRIYDQAQSEYGIALVAFRSYRFADAEIGFSRYAALVRRLIATNPANPDWQIEAGNAESNFGTFLLRTKADPVAAKPHFERAQGYFLTAQRARPKDPSIIDDIADGHAWLADCDRALKLYDDARANRVQQEHLLGVLLAGDPKNVEYANISLGNALGFAQIDLDQQHWGAARTRLESAYGAAVRLVPEDPTNKKLARQKIAIGLFLAKALLHETPLPGARVHDLLADCATSTAQGDQELRDFCATVAVQAAGATGSKDEAAFAYLARNHDRLSKIRRSPRWGIDFHDQ